MKPAPPPLLHRPCPPAGCRGVSLIELMIAMTIGLIIVATISYAYLGAQASFRSQTATSRVQENARYAFEFIGEDIRMAGFTGSANDVAVNQPAAWTDGHNDEYLQDLMNFPLRGYENDAAQPATPAGAYALTGRIAGTDALTVIHADADSEYRLNTGVSPNPNGATFTLSGGGAPSADGGFYVCSDFSQATAFSKTNTGTAAITSDNVGTVSPALCATGVCRIYPLKSATYFIRNNTNGQPSLFRRTLQANGTATTQELVEGVADMQVTYGVATDATPDTNVNAYWNANQVTAGSDGALAMPAGTASDYWKRVLSVRVQLTLTTLTTENVSTSGGQLTKTFAVTFTVRNRV